MSRTLVIAGATASGKSSLALAVARRIGGAIVNADAFQVYRGLETLTAQPSEEDLRQAPHHLYGYLSLEAEMTAAGYAQAAGEVIGKIHAEGKTAILCGGTGLYIKALTHGLDPVPPSDPDLRRQLEQRPLPDLVEELCELDPEARQLVDLQNPRRVIRALEISLATGKPASHFRKSWQEKPGNGITGFAILPERELLDSQIAARTRWMFEQGVVEEVRRAEGAGPAAQRAIGFREIQQLLAGQLTQPECEERINRLTRQYAKRQGTWFRKETWMPLLPSGGEAALARILAPV